MKSRLILAVISFILIGVLFIALDRDRVELSPYEIDEFHTKLLLCPELSGWNIFYLGGIGRRRGDPGFFTSSPGNWLISESDIYRDRSQLYFMITLKTKRQEHSVAYNGGQGNDLYLMCQNDFGIINKEDNVAGTSFTLGQFVSQLSAVNTGSNEPW